MKRLLWYIIRNSGADPRVGVVALVPVPERLSLRNPRDRGVGSTELFQMVESDRDDRDENTNDTYHDLVSIIKEVLGEPEPQTILPQSR